MTVQIGLSEILQQGLMSTIQRDLHGGKDNRSARAVRVLIRAVFHRILPAFAEGVFHPLLNDTRVAGSANSLDMCVRLSDDHAARHAGVLILADLTGVQDVLIQRLVQTLVGALNVAAVAHRADAGQNADDRDDHNKLYQRKACAAAQLVPHLLFHVVSSSIYLFSF